MTVFTPLSTPTKAPSGELAYFAKISPDEANVVLTNRNLHNRTLKGASKIEGVARDIKKNKFVLNGETIKFNKQGRLDDGQHRLNSIVSANKSIVTLVIENVSSMAQATVDTGSKRTVADQLQLLGFRYTAAKAAMAKNILLWEEEGFIRSTGSNGYNPSDTEIRKFVEKNDMALQHTYDTINVAYSTSSLRLFQPGITAALHYITHAVLPVESDDFFGNQLVQGIGLVSGAPALAFRKFNQDSQKRSLLRHEQFGYLSKAWDLYRNGEQIKNLRGPNNGWTIKNLPPLNLDS